jgi:hypothetical protein
MHRVIERIVTDLMPSLRYLARDRSVDRLRAAQRNILDELHGINRRV